MSAEPGDVIFVVADFSIVVVSGGLRCHLADRFSILVKQLSLDQDHQIPLDTGAKDARREEIGSAQIKLPAAFPVSAIDSRNCGGHFIFTSFYGIASVYTFPAVGVIERALSSSETVTIW